MEGAISCVEGAGAISGVLTGVEEASISVEGVWSFSSCGSQGSSTLRSDDDAVACCDVTLAPAATVLTIVTSSGDVTDGVWSERVEWPSEMLSFEMKEEDDNGGSGSINSGDDVTSRETDASSCEITWVGASVSDDVFELERRVLFDRIKV